MKKIYKYMVEKELFDLEIIDKNYFKDYIDRITSKENKLIRYVENKIYKYYCTHCKQWHVDKKVNYKQIKKCPNCNRKYEVITKRNKIEVIKDYITVVETNERNELIIRCFHFWKEYSKPNMSFEFDCFEVGRINVDRDVYMKMNTFTTMGYIHHVNNGTYKPCKDGVHHGYYRAGRMTDLYFYGFVITNGIKKIIKKTQYRYSCLDIIARKHIDILEYLNVYKTNREMELLAKNGNFKLINDLTIGRYGTTLLINKNFKYLKYDLNLKEFEHAVEFNLMDIKKIKKYAYLNVKGNMSYLKNIDISIDKLIEYLYKQKQDINYYSDYYHSAKKLGMPMYRKEIIFPNNLTKSHDEVMEKYSKFKNKINNEFIKQYASELKEFEFREKNLIIIPATSLEELINESEELKHCVRNYAVKMANRETAIFFIRSVRKKNIPYVTLELNGQEVKQCRTYNNAKPNQRVIEFVNHWCDKFKLESCFS